MIFFTVLTIIIFLSYTYIGWRLIIPSRFKVIKKRIAWTILLLLPLLVPLSFLLQITMDGSYWSDLLGWVAYTRLGFFSLLLGLLFFRDPPWAFPSGVRNCIALFNRTPNPVPAQC